LVFNDIHSNWPALQAVWEDAKKYGPYEGLLCGGDIVGYGPCPNECVEFIAQNGFVSVLGNHDRAVCGGGYSDFNSAAKQGISINKRLISPGNLEYLGQLKAEPVVDSGGKFALVHGSFCPAPGENFEDTYIRGKNDALPAMSRLHCPLGIFAHHHLPNCTTAWIDIANFPRVAGGEKFFVRGYSAHWIDGYHNRAAFNRTALHEKTAHCRERAPPGFCLAPDEAVINPGKPPEIGLTGANPAGLTLMAWDYRTLFNPGAVGQPRHGSPEARYGIVEFNDTGMALKSIGVKYDVGQTQAKMRELGLHKILVERLTFGV